MRLLAGPAAVLVLVFATACGGGSSTTPTQAGGDNPGTTTAPGAVASTAVGPAGATCAAVAAAGSGDQVISMEGTHSLNPADATVTVGQAVTYTNNSPATHHIKFSNGTDCGFTLIGKSSSVTFSSPGSYAYLCQIHPNYMRGTITVQ